MDPTILNRRLVRPRRVEAIPVSKSRPATIDMANMAAQDNCALFAKLPGEIRRLIFADALAPQDDVDKPYRPDRGYYRPGQHFHPKTSVALLQTCKRIFEEARLLPVRQATFRFWWMRGPWMFMRSHRNGEFRVDLWQESLSEEQKAHVQSVQVFAQQYILEQAHTIAVDRMPETGPLGFATKHFHLTLRNSDWWSWESPIESSDRLGICPWLRGRVSQQEMLAQPLRIPLEKLREHLHKGTWGWHICQLKGLQRLEIEFETDLLKRGQVEKVLERAKHWIFPLADRSGIMVKTGDVVESEWEGVAHTTYDHILQATESQIPQGAPTRTHYVALMTWTAASETSEQYISMVADELST
ncbi:hypothetical protein JX265_005802 [Neoarthrinium moseri]|uniref:Uncharacterized protein n=1 Tax=Neoarthrinium moseri TaxID=1658444 RepID=A0A9Q0AR32_9PEZI|nr:uncharacterized protein JN550_011661 [Neoarthrinium moseri]KAI1860283.1 hypothetical protein JN550_011661 [Neoarthrinium moseri]KAI1871816.1 hypothetical protein JX265_005802 [Neoarthrinium moseri]